MRMRRSLRNDRGTALIEAAMTVPLILLIMVGIFEVGRAYQTWQVLTNAAREGARMAIIPGTTVPTAKAMVVTYMQNGQLPMANTAYVDVNQASTLTVNGNPVSASAVTVDYPFDFMILQPIARLVVPGSNAGQAITMRATAVMRNEQ
jgi:Flp pilus assembly protein TadG